MKDQQMIAHSDVHGPSLGDVFDHVRSRIGGQSWAPPVALALLGMVCLLVGELSLWALR